MEMEVFSMVPVENNSEEQLIKRGPKSKKWTLTLKVLSLEPTFPPSFLLGELITILNF